MVWLETLEMRRLKNDIILAFRIIKKQIKIPFEEFFAFRNEVGTRGNKKRLLETHYRKDTLKYSFAIRVRRVWNILPDGLVNQDILTKFKKLLSKTDLTLALNRLKAK